MDLGIDQAVTNKQKLNGNQLKLLRQLISKCNIDKNKTQSLMSYLIKNRGKWFDNNDPTKTNVNAQLIRQVLKTCTMRAAAGKKGKKKNYQPYYKFHPIYGNLRY